MPDMLLLFSHQLTDMQYLDARQNWGVETFVHLPSDLQHIWSNVPPNLPSLETYALPILNWLESVTKPGDLVLVHGDAGMVHLAVSRCGQLHLIPVYATTERLATEQKQPDGRIITSHVFLHKGFRKYPLSGCNVYHLLLISVFIQALIPG